MSLGDVFSTAGSIAGSFFGPVGSAFGGALGQVIGDTIDPVKLDDIVGPQLEGFELTGSQYGQPVVVAFGRGPVTFNLDWSTGLVEHEQEETTGGKAPGPEQTTRTFTYTASFGGSVVQGQATLLKAWRDGELVIDYTAAAGPWINSDFLIKGVDEFRWYPGDPLQLPDPDEQADKGVNTTSAYRQYARLVLIDHDVTDTGRIPTWELEIATGPTTEQTSEVVVPLSKSTVADGLVLYPDGRTLVAGAAENELVFIDTVSQTEVLAVDLPEVFGFGLFRGGRFDALENFYSIRHVNTLTVSAVVIRYNGDTWTVDGMSDVTGSPIYTGAIAGGIKSLEVFGLYPGAQLVATSGNFDDVYISSAEPTPGSVQTSPDFDNPVLEVRHHYEFNDLLGNTNEPQDFTVDGEGYLWCLSRDVTSNELDLVRFEPVFGNIDVTITGVATGVADSNAALGYDPASNSLIFWADGTLYRWGIDSLTMEATAAFSPAPGTLLQSTFNAGATNGELWVPDGFSSKLFDVDDWSIVRTEADASWPSGQAEGMIYDWLGGAFVRKDDNGSSYFFRYVGRLTGGETNLKVVVDGVSDLCGVAASDRVTTELAAIPVRFAKAGSRQAGRRFLEPLLRAHFVRVRPHEFGVEFKARPVTATFALTVDDLGAVPLGNAAIPAFDEKVKDPLTLPLRVDVAAKDPNSDYERIVEPSQRAPEVGLDTQRIDSIEYPGALTVDEARQIGEKALYAAYAAGVTGNAVVDWSQIAIEPADVGTVDEGGVVRTMEVVRADFGADWTINLQLDGADAETLSSTASGADTTIVNETIRLAGQSELIVVDGPAPTDLFGDRLARMLFAGPRGDGPWRGTMVERSADGVDDWRLYAAVPKAAAATFGRIVAALAPGATTIFDHDNTIKVRLNNGSLTSATEAQILADHTLNGFFVHGPNGWEYGQFTTAAAQGNGEVWLTGLRRGRRGTERQNAVTKPAQSRIVFPTTASTIDVTFAESEITNPATTTYFRTIDAGGRRGKVIAHVIEGRSKWPYAPARVQFVSLVADTWTARFQRRSRDGKSDSFSGVRLAADDLNDFEAEVLDPADDSVKRTLTTTATPAGSGITTGSPYNTIVYDNDDVTTDFGGPIAELKLRVYQKSLIDAINGGTGRGEYVEVLLRP